MTPCTRNRAFQAAYNKGYEAARKGEIALNPYADFKTWRGSVTFSRAFRRYWDEGYADGMMIIEEPRQCP